MRISLATRVAVSLAMTLFCFTSPIFFTSELLYAATKTTKARETERQKEFASFIDGFFAAVEKEGRIPGMVLAAVEGDRILYMKGYGVANVESRQPVTPSTTLFRVAEISQPVTATAILQLVEKRRLSLDEDVNTYLRRSKLPKTFKQPVTLRHLLTHSGGFDDKKLEICAPTSSDERTYSSRLQKTMPARYMAPGLCYSESSMGYALAGSIVERYSRRDFNQAIKKHVFSPLSMNTTTFAPTDEERQNLATGYDISGNPVPYLFRNDMPGMGMSSTAADMARFMLSQLQEGKLEKNRILLPTYSNSMLRRHFSPNPMINGTGLGYYEQTISGLRTLQRQGDIFGYSSLLMLIPERKFGLFFAANAESIKFREELASAVVRRFFPTSLDVGPRVPAETSASIRKDVAGYYRTNRIARKTAEKALNILGPQLKVEIERDGRLLKLTEDGSARPERWLPVGKSGEEEAELFRLVDENRLLQDRYLFFSRDELGEVIALSKNDVGHTYDKLPFYESNFWQILFILVFFATFLLSLIGFLVSTAINKSKLPWEKGLRAARELWAISALFCLIQFSFVVGMAIAIFSAGRKFVVFVPYQVKALFVVPLVGGLLLAWLWFRILANLFNPDHHWAEKMLLIAVACVQTGYMLFLAEWRLLGFMF